MMGISFASLIAGVANPVYVYYRDGVLYFLTGTDTPFCEKGSTAEFYLNVIYTLVMVFITVCGSFSMQLCSVLVCNTIDVTTDLTIMELDELSNLLERNNLPKIKVQMRIKRAILQILRSDRYVQLRDLPNKF